MGRTVSTNILFHLLYPGPESQADEAGADSYSSGGFCHPGEKSRLSVNIFAPTQLNAAGRCDDPLLCTVMIDAFFFFLLAFLLPVYLLLKYDS